MIGFSIEVQNAKVVAAGLEDLSTRFMKVGRLRLYRIAQRARSRIIKPPKKFAGKWTAKTVKQWRYVNWAVRKGGMVIPYQRQRRYAKSWRIMRTEEGYDLVGGGYYLPGTGMFVGDPAAVYIGGDAEGKQQSELHRGRWAVARHVIDAETANVPWQIIPDLAVVAKNMGYPWE